MSLDTRKTKDYSEALMGYSARSRQVKVFLIYLI